MPLTVAILILIVFPLAGICWVVKSIGWTDSLITFGVTALLIAHCVLVAIALMRVLEAFTG